MTKEQLNLLSEHIQGNETKESEELVYCIVETNIYVQKGEDQIENQIFDLNA